MKLNSFFTRKSPVPSYNADADVTAYIGKQDQPRARSLSQERGSRLLCSDEKACRYRKKKA